MWSKSRYPLVEDMWLDFRDPSSRTRISPTVHQSDKYDLRFRCTEMILTPVLSIICYQSH